MLLAMDVRGATALLLLSLGLVLYRFWGLWPTVVAVMLVITYPSTDVAISSVELDFFRIPFNFGSEGFWWLVAPLESSACAGIGDVVHRGSCEWPAVPLERAGDDDEDRGPPKGSSEVLPNPDVEFSTTCRCWEQRSELCRLNPASDIFAWRIYRKFSEWKCQIMV